jgi:hypothetical protein
MGGSWQGFLFLKGYLRAFLKIKAIDEAYKSDKKRRKAL